MTSDYSFLCKRCGKREHMRLSDEDLCTSCFADEEGPSDAEIDRWHDGALDALRGKPKAGDDKFYLEGFAHGLEERKVMVVIPARSEGYYHMPLGTFD
jgi:hypothetical protein